MNDKKQMRSAARLYAVQALFQMEASGQSADRIQREFLHWRIGREGEDADMVTRFCSQREKLITPLCHFATGLCSK